MTPNIEYYLEDCMEGMRRYPDGHFDLAIVDPPYGVGSVTYAPGRRQRTAGGYIDRYDIIMATLDMDQRQELRTSVVHPRSRNVGGFGDNNVSPPPAYFDELMRVSKRQIIWGGNYYVLPPSRGFVIWNKYVPENFSMAMCEMAWLSWNQNAKLWSGAPQGTKSDPRIHPTQKPIALYRWLLEMFAQPGDLILDTHVGSASSLIACYELGFNAVGYEIDPDYYRESLARLDAVRAQVTLTDICPELADVMHPGASPD